MAIHILPGLGFIKKFDQAVLSENISRRLNSFVRSKIPLGNVILAARLQNLTGRAILNFKLSRHVRENMKRRAVFNVWHRLCVSSFFVICRAGFNPKNAKDIEYHNTLKNALMQNPGLNAGGNEL